VTIVAQLVLPPLTLWQQENAIRHQAQRLVLFLKHAQQLAISSNKSVYVPTYIEVNNRCALISYRPDCQCANQHGCVVLSGNKTQLFKPGPMLISTTYTHNKPAAFQALTGLSFGHAGSFVLKNGAFQIKVVLNNLGRIRLCSLQQPVVAIKSC